MFPSRRSVLSDASFHFDRDRQSDCFSMSTVAEQPIIPEPAVVRSVKIHEVDEKPRIIDMGSPTDSSLPPPTPATPATPSTPSTTPPAASQAAMRHLFVAWSRGELTLLLLAIALSGVVAGAKTVYTLILGSIFEVFAEYGSGTRTGASMVHSVSTWCLGLVGLGLGKALFSSLLMALWITHGEARVCSVRQLLFRSLLSKEMGWFDTRGGGISGLMTEQYTQLRDLQTATSQLMGLIVSDAIVGVACLIVALVKSWQLTLMLLATVPVAVVALNALGRRMKPAAQRQRLELNQAAKHATAALEAIDLVKVYHGHDAALWQYGRSMRAATASYVRQAFGSSSQMGVIKLWMIDLFVIGFWFGIWLVTRGLATAGNILTAFYAVLTAFQSVEALGTQWVAILRGTVAGRALQDMIGDPIELARPKPSLKLPTPPSHVRLANVSFAYPSNPSKLVLRDCTMAFPPGQVSFVVGRSGSGKSTIADLLVRFYRPTIGHVFIDNVPIEALDAQWLRENVALIQQASTIFDGSLGWNIALGSGAPETVSTADIRLACQTALLQSTVAGLPQGLDTPVGPRGGAVALSGGQRQRLAVARAKIRDPAVLVLDETTSGLDPKSAQMVLEAVRAWRGQGHRTTIIITHDIAQIAADDHVFVMDRGRLVQDGSFARLNRSTGLLGTLVQAVTTKGNEAAAAACLSPVDKIGLDHDEGTLTHQKSVCLSPVERWRRARAEHQDSSFFRRGSFLAAPFASGSYTQRPQSVVNQLSNPIPEVPYAMPEIEDDDLDSNESIQHSIDLLCDQGVRAQRNRPGRKVRNSVVSEHSLLTKNQTPSADHLAPSVALLHVLRTVWPLLNRASRLDAVVGLACCVLVAACNPVFSYVFARMLSSFWSPEENKEAVGRPWALVLLGLSVIDGSAVFGTFYLAERVGQAWINALRTEAMTRLLRQPKSWWSGGQEAESSDPNDASSTFATSSTSPLRIVECLDRGGEEMRKLVSIFVPILTMAAVMVVISVIWSLSVSWRLTLVSLASGPVIIGATHLASRISDTWEDRCNRAAETVSAVFTETFPHIRVVRAFTLESCFSARLTTATRAAFTTGLGRAWRTGVLYGFNQALSDWLTALVFYYGTQLLTAAITSGAYLSVNEVMRVVNLLLFSIGSAAALLGNVPQIAAAKTVAAQILAYSRLSLHASSHEHPTVPLARPRQLLPVQMDDLVFRYPGTSSSSSATTTDTTLGRPAILHGISLTIGPDEFVGLVGSSGSGKSTILSLLLRLYDTDRLSFHGMPAHALDTQAVRTHMAYVPQHPYLFPTTVRDNITYGLDEDSPLRQDACIADAARAANIHAFIVSLAQGYDTQVGDVASTSPSSSSGEAKSDGVSAFSGGQAQRICIARAMLRRPELLVLDEPTSALDAESAHTIRNTLRQVANYRNGSSIVVATHSKAMMQQCDRLIVVQDGVIVANGPYSYLLQHSDAFSQLMGEYDD